MKTLTIFSLAFFFQIVPLSSALQYTITTKTFSALIVSNYDGERPQQEGCDTLIMKSGNTLFGKVLRINTREVLFEYCDSEKRLLIARDSVEEIRFSVENIKMKKAYEKKKDRQRNEVLLSWSVLIAIFMGILIMLLVAFSNISISFGG